MSRIHVAVAASMLIILASSGSQAKPAEEQPAAIRALIDCRSIADAAARLACYDRRVGEIKTATEQDELVVMDKDAVRKTRRSLFGFTLPRLPFLGGGQADESKDDEADRLEANVKSVRSLGYDKWAFALDDGARWETTEALGGRDPRAGGTVIIKRGALGSYMAQFDGGRWVRVRRNN